MAISPEGFNESKGKCLTIAELEAITGFGGIIRKEIPLTLEFYNSHQEKILEICFSKSILYRNEVERNPGYYIPIAEMGEKAGLATAAVPYRITFLKGKYCVMIQTPLEGGKPRISREQLIAAGKIIAARL